MAIATTKCKYLPLESLKALWKPYSFRCGGPYHVKADLVLADICSGPKKEWANDNMTRYRTIHDVG